MQLYEGIFCFKLAHIALYILPYQQLYASKENLGESSDLQITDVADVLNQFFYCNLHRGEHCKHS